ncbi:IclR family transcriptional regulator [Ketogulonicigenium robustum]|uniref:IclR family transcriptional regulator n=1 Tax=Ketogulonicigenium robustum TaxID=92947 RepID=A0A1W6NXC5_9RHOB|nr:SMP-30/gluconolactonase/LRE family protein [Ketogulonicigenium robustum]ARO13839.1 IclR family transcriptional regulator [Ketogulonicigenium robustum]
MTHLPEITVVHHDGGDRLGETPLWCDQTQDLTWLDIEQPRLHRLHPATGAHSVTPFDCDWLGSQALCTDGTQLIAKDLTLHTYDARTGASSPFVAVEDNAATGFDNRLNDGRVDQWGRLWIGTMDNQLHRPNGAFYRVDGDASVTRIGSDVIVANGIAFSPDGRRMHFTDTRRHQSWVYDIDPADGEITSRRIWADYSATGDRPDGAAMDVDGCLWAAFFGGGKIVRYTPDGRIDREIALPVTNPTCLCFGGPDYRTLYITTAFKFLSPAQRAAEPLAGALLAIDGIGQGLPEHRFKRDIS